MNIVATQASSLGHTNTNAVERDVGIRTWLRQHVQQNGTAASGTQDGLSADCRKDFHNRCRWARCTCACHFPPLLK